MTINFSIYVFLSVIFEKCELRQLYNCNYAFLPHSKSFYAGYFNYIRIKIFPELSYFGILNMLYKDFASDPTLGLYETYLLLVNKIWRYRNCTTKYIDERSTNILFIPFSTKMFQKNSCYIMTQH